MYHSSMAGRFVLPVMVCQCLIDHLVRRNRIGRPAVALDHDTHRRKPRIPSKTNRLLHRLQMLARMALPPAGNPANGRRSMQEVGCRQGPLF